MIRTPTASSASRCTSRPTSFFCLGDNSPMSHDGRYWNEINPWVEKRMFDDENHIQRIGVVPREA